MGIRTVATGARDAIRRLLGKDVDAPRIQADSWHEDGVETFVAVVQGEHGVRALVARLDTHTNLLSKADASLERCPSHHDLRAIAEGVVLEPMTWRTMAVLGLLAEDKQVPLAEILSRSLVTAPEGRGTILTFPLDPDRPRGLPIPVGPGNLGMHIPRFVAGLRARAYGVPAREPEAYGFPKAAMPRYALVEEQIHETPLAAPGLGKPWGLTRFPRVARMDRADLERTIAARIVEGTEGLRRLCLPEAIHALGPHGWTAPGYAWYAASGETGRRRRQAAAIHPGFAPTIAGVPAVADRVDAARPFEAALLDAIRPLCQGGEPLSAAALHRMRTLPPYPHFEALAEIVPTAASLPVDWLPLDAKGWADFHNMTRSSKVMIAMAGLRLADLARETGRDWAAFLAIGNDGPRERGMGRLLVNLSSAWDMASHFRATLVSPLARSLGVVERNADEGRIASRILFEGKALRAVNRLQERWHATRASLEARLPPPAEGNAWPAAFAPFEGPGGIRIACLTNEAALRAEGGEGPDADGVTGLGHCVGGYGRNCYTAASFVASVRRPEGAGWIRLSTLELRLLPDEDEAPRLVAIQHRGAGNADPAPEAVAAVEALLAALNDGTHPVDGEALAPREATGFIDAFDWRVDGALEQAFDAWRPHMPAGMAHAGLEGLRQRLRSEAQGWPDTPQAESPGNPLGLMAMPVPAEAARLLLRNIRDYHQDRDLAFPVG